VKNLWERHAVLLALLFLALSLRIAYLVLLLAVSGENAIFNQPDTASYLAPARAFLETGSFIYPDGRPEIFRTPGVPLFLATMLAFFGEKYYLGAALAQILLGLLAIVAIYALAWKLTQEKKTALLAAFLASIAPGSIVYANLLLSDSLTQSFMAFLLYFYGSFLLEFDRHFDGKSFLAGSLMLFCMIFLRPTFLYLAFALFPGFAAFLWAKGAWRKIAPVLVLLALTTLLPVALWTARNEALGGVRQFSTAGPRFLLDSVSVLYAKSHGIHYYEAQPIVYRGKDEDLQPYLAIMPKEEAYKKRAIEMIRADPMTYGKAYLLRVPCLFFYPETNDVLRFIPSISALVTNLKASFIARSLAPLENPGLTLAYLMVAGVNTLALVVIFLFAVCGLFANVDPWVKRLMLGILLYVAFLSCLPVGYGSYPRYRLGINMPLTLFAALGARALLARFRQR
jgi:hypothetical protein